MSWATGYGFNFRETEAYIPDGTNEMWFPDGSSASGIYPQTKISGVVAGFLTTVGGDQNIDNTRDRRLAGAILRANSSGSEATFQVDLPAAGDYEIGLAVGSNGTVLRLALFDGATTLFSLDRDDHTGSSTSARDAQGTNHTYAAWPANQALRSITMAGTSLTVRIGGGNVGNSTRLHHLFVRQVSAGGNKFRPYFITG
jgi:hypothetical protein